MDLSVFFRGAGPSAVERDRLAGALDGVGHEARVRAVVEIRRRQMADLFEACADAQPLGLDDFVPADRPDRAEVIHHGKNSLPAFTRFQKRFCRPAKDDPARGGEPAARLWGYNHQTLQPVTGPGYFVVHVDDRGLVIDYTLVPPDKPEGWPAIVPNTAIRPRLVYGGMKDYMRRVSSHVTIGRAHRGSAPMDAWFVLVREDPPS